MGKLLAVEIIGRGIFQDTLAKNITRGIVLAAHNEGKLGLSFGRYGDSPERNGIPSKKFAIVASDDQTLQLGMAHYEPSQVDVSIVLDDTLCKGIESWAWDGVHAINRAVKRGGTLIVVSTQDPDTLLKFIHRREQPYKLGILKGIASFSGLWVYKDDHTDVRVLGALAQAAPELFSLQSVEKYIQSKLKDGAAKAQSAHRAYERFTSIEVPPGRGNAEELLHFELLKWQDIPEGLAVKGIPQGGPFEDPVTKKVGGFRPARNNKFLKYTTRTQRPVVNFDTCTKCTLCWLNCPDGSFDVTPDGTYDANLNACCGCGICEAVCPVENCITMVNETKFYDTESQWLRFKRDEAGYLQWLEKTIQPTEKRSHGFRYRGQYKEELPAALELAQKG
jgi:pyruvate ferredoxin oxidoreductase delta subunit